MDKPLRNCTIGVYRGFVQGVGAKDRLPPTILLFVVYPFYNRSQYIVRMTRWREEAAR